MEDESLSVGGKQTPPRRRVSMIITATSCPAGLTLNFCKEFKKKVRVKETDSQEGLQPQRTWSGLEREGSLKEKE